MRGNTVRVFKQYEELQEKNMKAACGVLSQTSQWGKCAKDLFIIRTGIFFLPSNT